MFKKGKDIEYDVNSINFNNRTIFLYDHLDDSLAYKIVSKLHALNSIDSKKPIIFRINTPGGYCSSGMAIISTMDQINAPVHTIIEGEACSMGSFISVIGDKRYATKYALWMAHDLVDDLPEEKLRTIIDRTAFLKRYDKVLDNIYRKHTKLSDMEIEKAKNGELWLFPSEMLKRNIIDEII